MVEGKSCAQFLEGKLSIEKNDKTKNQQKSAMWSVTTSSLVALIANNYIKTFPFSPFESLYVEM